MNTVRGINKSFKSLSIMSLKLAGSLSLVTLGAKKMRDGFMAQEKAVKGMEAVLRSTGRYSEETSEKLQKIASDLQDISNYGDELTLAKATRTLLTFSNIGIDSIERVQKAVADMSATFDTDLKSSALQLGKALDNPIANLGALSRIGVSFTDQEKKKIKVLAKSNKLFEAQNIILTAVEKQVKGGAESQMDSAIQTKNAWGDVIETLGGKLAPAFEKIFRGMTASAEKLNEKIKAISFEDMVNSKPFIILNNLIKGVLLLFDKMRLAVSIVVLEVGKIDFKRVFSSESLKRIGNITLGIVAMTAALKAYNQVKIISSSIMGANIALKSMGPLIKSWKRLSKIALDSYNVFFHINKVLIGFKMSLLTRISFLLRVIGAALKQEILLNLKKMIKAIALFSANMIVIIALVIGFAYAWKAVKDNAEPLKEWFEDFFSDMYKWINKAYQGMVKLVNTFKMFSNRGTIKLNQKTIVKSQELSEKGAKGETVTLDKIIGLIATGGFDKKESYRLQRLAKAYGTGYKGLHLTGSNLENIAKELEDASRRNIETLSGENEARKILIDNIEDVDLKEDMKPAMKAVGEFSKEIFDVVAQVPEDIGKMINSLLGKFKLDIDTGTTEEPIDTPKETKGYKSVVDGMSTDLTLGSTADLGEIGNTQPTILSFTDKFNKSLLKFASSMPLVSSAAQSFSELGEITGNTFTQITGIMLNGLSRIQDYSSQMAKGTGFFGKFVPFLGIVTASVSMIRSATDSTKSYNDTIEDTGQEAAKANKSLKEFASELFNVSESINIDILRARTLSAFNQTVGGSINVVVETATGSVLSTTSHRVNSSTGTRVMV